MVLPLFSGLFASISAPAAAAAKPSAVVEPEKVSQPGKYEGYYAEGDLYDSFVTKSIYVEVPAQYPKDLVEFPSDLTPEDDPSYNAENKTIKLALS